MSLATLMKQIRDKALACKGAFVPYSQCMEPTSTLIKMLPYTKGGICQALSAKWIAEHANDRSLWEWLCTPGTTNVKQSAIANLMINFTESVQRTGALANSTTKGKNTGDLVYQDFVTDKYLGLYHLKRRSIVQPLVAGSGAKTLKYGYKATTGQELAVRLQEKWLNSRGGSYVLISIMGKGGHAVAAFVGQDIAFFDPNFGEYYFENQANFRTWFEHFWKLSGYQKEFNSFYFLCYGKKL